MVFVDTWAWIALAVRRDQHHSAAKRQHVDFVNSGSLYVTTDWIIGEMITQIYRVAAAKQAESFVGSVLQAIDSGAYRMEKVSSRQFAAAWQLRKKYSDKPSISFVDFTSMVVMLDLGINDVFTGDKEFAQVNLGFRLLPPAID
ncbi:MAG TPA: PIN domain-containing protein [Lacipirellulaceae bacterium]|nr:PIN domain-containing protein [Lacipirellulaceae bacterium]